MLRAVLDADVLYPLPLRDTLLSAAVERGFQPVWSAEILDEAIRNLLVDQRIDGTGALAGGASLIVTSTVRDFKILPGGITALTPDAFLLRLLAENRDQLSSALGAQSARLKRKPMDVAAIVRLLEIVAPRFAAAWRETSSSRRFEELGSDKDCPCILKRPTPETRWTRRRRPHWKIGATRCSRSWPRATLIACAGSAWSAPMRPARRCSGWERPATV